MIEPWKTLTASVGYDNRYARIIHERVGLPDGTEIDYFLSDRPDVVMAFAVTTKDEVVLVRQYKHGAEAITLELPGGALDEGERAIEGAARELEEETGYVSPSAPTLVSSFHDDATKNRNAVHVVLFKDVQLKGEVALDANEAASGIEVVLRPLAEVLPLVRSGEIRAESSVAGIYRGIDALSADQAPSDYLSNCPDTDVAGDPNNRRKIPSLVGKAHSLAAATGFDGSCSNAVGWLLATTAATTSGHILELGAGVGVGTSWLLHGARSDARITTVEIDSERADHVTQLFAADSRVNVVQGTFDDIKDQAPYKLVFIDIADLKDDGSPLIPLLEPGAVVVLDDFTPEWLKDEVWRKQLDTRRQFWLNHPDFTTTEILTTTTSSALVAVRR